MSYLLQFFIFLIFLYRISLGGSFLLGDKPSLLILIESLNKGYFGWSIPYSIPTKFLFHLQMLLEMSIPILFIPNYWLCILDIDKQVLIFLLDLLLLLNLFKTSHQQLVLILTYFSTGFLHLRQQSLSIINFQQVTQHLFVLYLSLSIFFMSGLSFVVQRV